MEEKIEIELLHVISGVKNSPVIRLMVGNLGGEAFCQRSHWNIFLVMTGSSSSHRGRPIWLKIDCCARGNYVEKWWPKAVHGPWRQGHYHSRVPYFRELRSRIMTRITR